MKDYNFMISDDRLHQIRFCKKKRGGQNFLHKGGGLEQKGGFERFRILRGGVGQKEGGDFFKEGGCSYPGAHYEQAMLKQWNFEKQNSLMN